MSSCTGGAVNGTSIPYYIDIITLSGVQPSPITMTQGGQTVTSIPALSSAPVTLCTASLYYQPFYNGTAQAPVTVYEWTIPNDWAWPSSMGGGTSNGTPRRINSQSGNCITVTPNAGGSNGTASVRAINNYCTNSQPPSQPSSIRNLSIQRPRPEIQLSAASQTINCGRGITPSVTASLTMPVPPSGYSVSYTWSIVSQQVQSPPAPSGGSVLSTFSTGAMTSPTGILNGVATTGNPGTATLRCVATITGPGGYTSTSSLFTVTVGSTVVTPVITPAKAVVCAAGQAVTLTAQALGATTMYWSSPNPDVRFAPNGSTTPTPTLTTTVSSTTGNATALISITGSNPAGGARVIRAQGQNPAKCFSSTTTESEVFYGKPSSPDDLPFTQQETAYSSSCSKEYLITLPAIPGATSYQWRLDDQFGSSNTDQVHGTHNVSVGGSPRYAGVTVGGVAYPASPTPPQWTIRPVITHQPLPGQPCCNTDLYMVGNNYGALVHYAGVNVCGTAADFNQSSPTYTGPYASLSLDAMAWPVPAGGCRWYGGRPAPPPPGPVAVRPVPADERLLVSWATDLQGVQLTEVAPDATLELIDLFGEVRLARQVRGTEHELSTRALPAGPYLLRVRRGEVVETRRVAIQH